MNRIISIFIDAYDILACAFLLATLHKNWKKLHRGLQFFALYAGTSLLYLTVLRALKYTFHNLTYRSIYSNALDIVFSLVELLTFFAFFSYTFKSKNFDLAAKISYTGFSIAAFVVLWAGFETQLTPSERNHLTDVFIGFQTMSLSIMAIYYYVWLFRQPIIADIEKDSIFRIATGVLFYSLFMASFFFVSEFMRITNYPLFSLFYSLHLIMFGSLFLVIAWACKQSSNKTPKNDSSK